MKTGVGERSGNKKFELESNLNWNQRENKRTWYNELRIHKYLRERSDS